jgi:hypothetical protein
MRSRASTFRAFGVSGVALVLFVASGCATQREKLSYQVEVRKISVDTTPPGATVYQIGSMDGARTMLGTTPIKDQSVVVTAGAKFKHISPGQMQSIVSQLEMVQVVIEKPGFQTYRGNLATQQGGKVAEHTIKLEAAPTTKATVAAAP